MDRIDNIKQQFDDDLRSALNSIKKPNILLLGNTGVGKSSLINTVFGKELAKVSHVKPETVGFHTYSTPNVPVTIIDSEGFELDNESKFRNNLNEYIDKNFSDITKQIHICWYCISISSRRVLPYDIDNIRFLISKNIPTCVVFTQCDNDTPEGEVAEELSSVIYRVFLSEIKCFQTCNDPEINKDLDLEKLIEWSINNIKEENLKKGFIKGQIVSLSPKKKEADKIIMYYSGAAAGIAATPIPFSDSLALTALQVKMAADIYSIYGFENCVGDNLLNFIKGKMVSMLGKMLVAQILKFIPGGNVAGCLINATVACSITYALGKAISKWCHTVIEGNMEGKNEVFPDLDQLSDWVGDNLK